MNRNDSANKKMPADFSDRIREKEKLKISAGRDTSGSVWSGLGMFGIVGWSVSVPTLLGAALGIWLDKKYHPSFSWTLTMLMAGLVTGSLIAWYWVSNEDKVIHKKNEDSKE
jgi:ATP synthase protein I